VFDPKTYQAIVLNAVPRVLNLLDRNPSSKTYGCFDRSYWLHRKTDFPASTAQMLTATLAQLYSKDFPGNLYFKNSQILEWTLAALRFTRKIQHSDGSFDEWYPNERGWAGPTGYVAHSICETLDLLGAEVPQDLRTSLFGGLAGAAAHLNHRDEKDVLANHYAIAILPLFQIAKQLNSPKILEHYEDWQRRLLALQTEEGWFLEYDGCDLGYSLGTLDFLASLHRLNKDSQIMAAAKRCMGFISYFAYPDGEWAGALGSRHTTHSYPFALEYWAHEFPEGRALLQQQRASIEKAKALLPDDQEDHYLPYRLRDYLKAAEVFYSGPGDQELPYLEKSFRGISFPRAKLEIFCSDSYRIWIAGGRGGAYRVYEKSSGRLLQKSAGVLLQDEKGKTFTSLWQGSSIHLKQDSIVVEGKLEPVFQRRFSPLTFLLFRLFCIVSGNRTLAFFLKVMIRRWMITHRVASSYQWRRELLLLPSEIQGKDQIVSKRGKYFRKVWWGGEFHSRYVPQGNYFLPSDLSAPIIPIEGSWSRWEIEYKIDASGAKWSVNLN
jgi:hypothetical protein